MINPNGVAEDINTFSRKTESTSFSFSLEEVPHFIDGTSAKKKGTKN